MKLAFLQALSPDNDDCAISFHGRKKLLASGKAKQTGLGDVRLLTSVDARFFKHELFAAETRAAVTTTPSGPSVISKRILTR
jgi:hypothetical protein